MNRSNVQPAQWKFLTRRQRRKIFLNRVRKASGIMLVLVVLSFMAKTFFAPLSNATQVVSAANTGETRSEWVKSVMAQGLKQDIR